MIRATHGVHSGSYYFEVQILNESPLPTTATATSRTITNLINPFRQYDKGVGNMIRNINNSVGNNVGNLNNGVGNLNNNGVGKGGNINDDYVPHYRLGWASRQAELEGPLGYDKFGFAYRSKSG